jgi:hypothetical protein
MSHYAMNKKTKKFLTAKDASFEDIYICPSCLKELMIKGNKYKFFAHFKDDEKLCDRKKLAIEENKIYIYLKLINTEYITYKYECEKCKNFYSNSLYYEGCIISINHIYNSQNLDIAIFKDNIFKYVINLNSRKIPEKFEGISFALFSIKSVHPLILDVNKTLCNNCNIKPIEKIDMIPLKIDKTIYHDHLSDDIRNNNYWEIDYSITNFNFEPELF